MLHLGDSTGTGSGLKGFEFELVRFALLVLRVSCLLRMTKAATKDPAPVSAKISCSEAAEALASLHPELNARKAELNGMEACLLGLQMEV